MKNIAPIKDETNLYRDISSNAILFANPEEGPSKRTEFLRSQIKDINNLKKEVSEIKDTLSKILEILSKENNP
jgi:hypothetical protein